GWLHKAWGSERADVTRVVGVIEDVEGGEAGGEDFGLVSSGLGEMEVMVPEEVEVGCASTLESVATDSGGASIAETGVEVVVAGCLGIGRAGVETGVNPECEPAIGIDVSDEIEGVKAIEAGTSPVVIGVVLVLRETSDAAGIVFHAGEGVLS